MSDLRTMLEERERQSLSPYAALACESEGRARPEPLDAVRTAFMKDRDRILHSKPFRRLKHKTQVFIAPVGDHYRTRLTHTLEVAQIARTLSRVLRLNEDLTEAIALGHDVGHPPFGHAGERALDEALKDPSVPPGGPSHFHHSEHSLRVVDILTPLNLTAETRRGIGGHSKGRADLSAHDGEPVSTLEAAVVRISDRIAYLNHDLDDAFRSGVITSIPEVFADLGSTHGARIERMVTDVITHSLDQPAIRLSPTMLQLMNDLKEWMFENVYLSSMQNQDVDKAEFVVRSLLIHFATKGTMPEGFTGVQGALDYVAGMTDRFALSTYRQEFLPLEFEERLSRIP